MNGPHPNNNMSLVIRILHTDGAIDWNIEHPNMVTFDDTKEAIRQIYGNDPSSNNEVVVQAFEYEDEDGDRITVRSEEEMRTMLQQYCSASLENGRESEPLVIYPRVGKTAGKRNIEGLKVKTKSESQSAPRSLAAGGNKQHPVDMVVTEDDSMEHEQGSGSSRKTSGDIQQILACGNINNADLIYKESLGSGNCGTVFKAVHQPTKTTMAVKIIPVDISADARKQIIAELEILYRCNSPEIISFYGAYFMESRIRICTEFMDGGSLDKYGQIPEDILGRIAVSIVKGLQYLWSLKIMHRDVKPSNVLVNTLGQVKLCDFGVSVQLAESIAKTLVGTNAYMAPEKIHGLDYRVQSEVWSLGISLFEMAVGKFPYESANRTSSKPMDLLMSIIGKEPPQLPRGAFSDAFVDFVASCMQKEPSARPAPEALMKHPFIMAYNIDNTAVLARWVGQMLQAFQLRTT